MLDQWNKGDPREGHAKGSRMAGRELSSKVLRFRVDSADGGQVTQQAWGPGTAVAVSGGR